MLPVILIGGAIGLACMMCICGGLASSGGGGASVGGSEVDPGEFKDNPEAFVGRTISMDLQYWSNNPIRDLKEAHQDNGRPHYDIDALRISPSASLTLTVPTRLAVPALEHGNSMIVTFKCTKGSTDEGNIVTHMRRPNKYGD